MTTKEFFHRVDRWLGPRLMVWNMTLIAIFAIPALILVRLVTLQALKIPGDLRQVWLEYSGQDAGVAEEYYNHDHFRSTWKFILFVAHLLGSIITFL